MEEIPNQWTFPGPISVTIAGESKRPIDSKVLNNLQDCLEIFKNSRNTSNKYFIDTKTFSAQPGLEGTIQFAACFSNELFTKLENQSEGILKGDVDTILEIAQCLIQLKASGRGGGVPVLLGESLSDQDGITDTLLSLRIIKEAEVSRHLGYCSASTVARLSRCLSNYKFVTSTGMIFKDNQLRTTAGTRDMFILEEIGASNTVLAVSNQIINLVLQKHVEVIPSGPVYGTVIIPGSKSISNRVLLLAALGQGRCEIRGLLDSDDTQVMLNALEKFGASFEWKEKHVLVVYGTGGQFKEVSGEIYLRNAGTASRFLTTVAAFIKSPETDPLVLTGNQRMKERPAGPLVTALRSNGCSIEYLETEGCFPIRVKHTGLKGGLLELEGKVSSQYVSSVLISAPYAQKPLTLQLAEENPTSLPYITMTIELVRSFGVSVHVEGSNRFTIATGTYRNPPNWTVEPDASSATYFLAIAAITGGEVTVSNLGSTSLQGDAGFYRVLKLMGCTVKQTETTTTVKGLVKGQLKAFSLNMETMTDAFMTATVLAAVAKGRSHITGIANQRVKECNRILVMVTELRKLGVSCGELEDGIWVEGSEVSKLKGPVHIECHDDHRIAMSFAVLGSVVPGIIITDKECTGKTFPGFWDDCRLQLNMPLNLRRESPVIFLVGMRGCGKSTLGKLAAAALGLGFYNMDELLEREVNEPLPNFVAKYGWPLFRQRESELLLNLFANLKPGTIISCGGGIVESEANQKLLTETKYVVNIERDFGKLTNFLEQDQSRPSLGEPLEQIWALRKPLYEQVSDFSFHFGVDEDWTSINSRFIELIKRINHGG